MRNSHNITITESDTFAADDETTWSLPGAVVGFIAWLLALGIPFLIYGPNTLFFFIYTWPFFLALLPVAIVAGIALHSFIEGTFAAEHYLHPNGGWGDVWCAISVVVGFRQTPFFNTPLMLFALWS
ncbi:Inner membrane protein ygbE [Citrobacter freundii]|nr:Inner membrane protein ygbE [Citrobacter freundii]